MRTKEVWAEPKCLVTGLREEHTLMVNICHKYLTLDWFTCLCLLKSQNFPYDLRRTAVKKRRWQGIRCMKWSQSTDGVWEVGMWLMSYWWNNCDTRVWRNSKLIIHNHAWPPDMNDIQAKVVCCFEAPLDDPSFNHQELFIHPYESQPTVNRLQSNEESIHSVAFYDRQANLFLLTLLPRVHPEPT